MKAFVLAAALLAPGIAAAAAEFSLPQSFAFESADPPVARISVRCDAPGNASCVHYTVQPLTATAGVDFTAVSGQFFGTGDFQISVPLLNDTAQEQDEQFLVELRASPADAQPYATQVVTILDDESRAGQSVGQIEIVSADYVVNEGDDLLLVGVYRTFKGDSVNVNYGVFSGSARAGQDFASTSGTIIFEDGLAAAEFVEIPIVDDSIVEGDETFVFRLSDPVDAELGPNSSAQITIVDDDTSSPGTVTMVNNVLPANENSGTVQICAQRTGGQSGAASVFMSATDGNATLNADYRFTGSALSWLDGDVGQRCLPIALVNDTLTEGDETTVFSLVSASAGVTIGSPSQTSLIITDDEIAAPGTVGFSPTAYVVSEAAGVVVLTATRTGAARGPAQVAWKSFAGSANGTADYVDREGVLAWADGESGAKSIAIAITDDSMDEDAESFTVVLTAQTSGLQVSAATATVSITDDDVSEPTSPGVIEFAAAQVNALERDLSVKINLVRRGGAAGRSSVTVVAEGRSAQAGVDFQETTVQLDWEDQQDGLKSFALPITNDLLEEDTEQFVVRISGVNGTASVGGVALLTVNIIDDDDPVESAGSLQLNTTVAAIEEDAEPESLNLMVRRLGGASGVISVQWRVDEGTAKIGEDIASQSAFGSLSWGDGDVAEKPILISLIDDTATEGPEKFNVVLFAQQGGAALVEPIEAEVTLVDDESSSPGIVEFTQAEFSDREDGGKIDLGLIRRDGSTGAVSVSIAIAEGSASADDYVEPDIRTVSWADDEVGPKTVTIELIDDDLEEEVESFSVLLGSPTGGVSIGTGQAICLIEDDDSDSTGVFRFKVHPTLNVNRGAASARIGVLRVGGSRGAAGVSFATEDGTALDGVDYAASSGSLSWLDGEAGEKTITVTLMPEAQADGVESFSVRLVNPLGGVLDSQRSLLTVTLTSEEAKASGGAMAPAMLLMLILAVLAALRRRSVEC